MLLQMRGLNDRALQALGRATVAPDGDLDALEATADALVDRLRWERGRQAGPLGKLAARLDRAVRTDEAEYMDRDDVPPALKGRLVQALDKLNRTLLSYHRFLQILRPHLEAASKKDERPARVLELASGSGEFALELARLAAPRGLAVEVTGSDVVPEHVERGNEEARKRNLPVKFARVNAFRLDELPEKSHDVVFIAQSAHHFTPGQLARMIRGAHRVASEAFVLVDGYRSLWLLGVLAGAGTAASVAMGSKHFLHDAVTSGRRFYSEPELALIARLAAPDAVVDVRTEHPGLSVLTVR